MQQYFEFIHMRCPYCFIYDQIRSDTQPNVECVRCHIGTGPNGQPYHHPVCKNCSVTQHLCESCGSPIQDGNVYLEREALLRETIRNQQVALWSSLFDLERNMHELILSEPVETRERLSKELSERYMEYRLDLSKHIINRLEGIMDRWHTLLLNRPAHDVALICQAWDLM